MSSFQVTVLAVATIVVGASASVILWRELGRGSEGGFVQGWRDLLGLSVTLGGLAALLAWIWASR